MPEMFEGGKKCMQTLVNMYVLKEETFAQSSIRSNEPSTKKLLKFVHKHGQLACTSLRTSTTSLNPCIRLLIAI